MSNSRYNLQEYLTHIGLPADYKPEPTLQCLNEISWRHLRKFPYDNTYLYQEGLKPPAERVVPNLDPDDVFRQIVTNGKQTYCYRNQALLCDVLERIGFSYTVQMAIAFDKPITEIGDEDYKSEPYTHNVIKVTLDEGEFIIDTGFGNESLRGTLPLNIGVIEGVDTYQIEDLDGYYRLSVSRVKENAPYWYCMYQFNKQPATAADLNAANHVLFHADKVGIREKILYADVTDATREYAAWFPKTSFGLFKSTNNDGSVGERNEFTSQEELTAFAQVRFGCSLG